MQDVAVLMPTRSLRAVHPDCFPALATNECLKQVVVVVDGPCDADEERIAASLRDNYPQWDWCIEFTGAPSGIANALNVGIDHITRPLTARQDDDDISWPGRLDRQSCQLSMDDSLVALGGWIAYEKAGRKGTRTYPTSAEEIRRAMPFYNPLAHPTVMVRTDVLRRLKYSPMPCCEDYELWIRVAGAGPIKNLPEPLVTYGTKSPEGLQRFNHRREFRTHARLKWNHRRDFQLSLIDRTRFYGLIAAEWLFSLTPKWVYNAFYHRFLFP